jgi:hypothetical protein
VILSRHALELLADCPRCADCFRCLDAAKCTVQSAREPARTALRLAARVAELVREVKRLRELAGAVADYCEESDCDGCPNVEKCVPGRVRAALAPLEQLK